MQQVRSVSEILLLFHCDILYVVHSFIHSTTFPEWLFAPFPVQSNSKTGLHNAV